MGKLQFYITHSKNDLMVNRRRTFFALLCIAAGVAAIVSLQTLAVMMNNTLEGGIQESNRGDIRLNAGGLWSGYVTEVEDSGFTGSYALNSQGIEFLRDWLEENYPGSEMTYQQTVYGLPAFLSASIPERGTYQPFVINYIIDSDEYPLYGEVRDEDDKTLADLLNEPTDVVLSENLAETLEASVGDQFRISGVEQEFTVTGIVPADSEPGYANLAAHMFGYYYLDFSSLDVIEILEPELAGMVFIRLADPSQVDEAASALNRLSSNRTFDINTTTDLKEANSEVSDIVDDLVVVMGLVSLLIGGIGVANTMMVIVSRRTVEVAVLKTIGIEPHEVVLLFLVEAIIMGIIGSLFGILGGWVLAYAVKGVGEIFLGQRLAYTIAFYPAINGFVVGIIITTIFGFLPTLAAGQVRPANVLRPREAIVPSAGRLNSFVAMTVLVLAISVVAQGMVGSLFTDIAISDSVELDLTYLTTGLGGLYGLVIALSFVLGRFLSMRAGRRGRSWLLHGLLWIVLLVALPVGTGAFGYYVPAILISTATILLIGYLYVALWLVIWAVGGGRPRDLWPGVLVLLFPLFWPLIPVLIVLLIPTWILGWLIQRLAFVDFKIAMRSMLATKGRGASTLLALVVGVFTLSCVTMLVDTITRSFEQLLENATGGNVIIIPAGGEQTMQGVQRVLDENQEYIRSHSVVGNYNTTLNTYYSAGQARDLDTEERGQFRWVFSSMDGRGIESNVPGFDFYAGRNLNPALDSEPNAEGYWPAVVIRSEGGGTTHQVGLGDRFTVSVNGGGKLKFEVVGLAKEGILIGDSEVYAPILAFDGVKADEMFAIADVREENFREMRRALMQVPGTFVIETRFLNDLVNRIVDQFTSLPLLVAALALVTGGVVIANSVALSTMERRREIGIMKAIGLQRERVLGMLLLENGLMGVVGGLIGVGISFIGLVLILTQIFDDDLGHVIPYGTAFSLMALCIVISLGAALFSVWGASGEKPLNVLRND